MTADDDDRAVAEALLLFILGPFLVLLPAAAIGGLFVLVFHLASELAL